VVLQLSEKKKKSVALHIFFCHLCVFICKFCKFISSIRLKDLKKPIDPPLEEIRIEGVESGQNRQIKTPVVSGNVSPLSTCDPINQNASVTLYFNGPFFKILFTISNFAPICQLSLDY